MNVLTTTWRQLVRRRLWPVAVLLLAGLVAVPVLLSREPAPVTPPAQPANSAPAEQSAKADDSIAEPVVAKTSSTGKRRRVLGVRKDPFTPAIAKKKHKATKKATKKPAQETTKQETPVVSTPSTPVAPSVPSTPVAPAPKKKVYAAKDSLIVRFGDATTDLKRFNVKKLGPLSISDTEDPLLVYVGLTDHGKKAVFLVDESLDPSGDGTCDPHPSNCEKVELAAGETEFFDVIDDESGDVTAQYELDLVDIK
jgi:hypothetical protein